ncbi:MAG: PIG-L family deacetylase [Planctomycetes bacterium]|nr:PIG-L family deacetylase [Planctomycetota bacterium]
MSQRPAVFAVGAHPDDVEFGMAGTLSLLAAAGFEPHMMNVARSNLDSNELPEAEITLLRRREAERSAQVLGAVYHPPIVDDLMIFYEDALLRRLSAVVREIAPSIVLLPSLNDYMEDHTNAARLVITACFSRAMQHYRSEPPRRPTQQDVHLYHAQPHLNRDGMRNLVVPELFVDITSEMPTKRKMLGCHESQRRWLDETQGLDDYLESMMLAGAEVARLSGRPGCEYAEGFRRHSHVGFSAEDRDLLSEVLGPKVTRRAAASPP